MDLIGGSIPMGYVSGKGWVTEMKGRRSAQNKQIKLDALPDYGV